MMRQEDVQVGVVVQFIAPDGSPDYTGPVREVVDGFVWLGTERWPLDVVARESTAIPRPSPDHRWDGATGRWFLPHETQAQGCEIVLSHARHA